MKNNRLIVIDYLRAFAIVVMILTHSLVPYLGDNIFRLWDLIHFAVPIFIFCSGYLFFAKALEKKDFNNWHYIKKRIIRVVIPFFIFFAVYLLVLFFTKDKNFNQTFILQSFFLVGGIDINWLVLLFVQFAFLFPFLRYLIIKIKPLAISYYLLAIGLTIYLLFPNYPPATQASLLALRAGSLLTTNYKLLMWLPWSLIVIYSYFFYKYKDNKKFIYGSIITGAILFAISYFIRTSYGLSLGLFANKYPPNLYYLSYGFTIMNILYLFFNHLTISHVTINNFIFFISSNSYSLFFIHYIVIYLLRYFAVNQSVHWSLFFMLVLSVSMISQFLQNKLLRLLPTLF